MKGLLPEQVSVHRLTSSGALALGQGKAVPGIVERLLLGLLPALRSGEEGATLHARRLTTALQAGSHSLFAH
ncbi:hypothetical protein ABBQ38_001941 [Trebouxia sp. C0009 RCD-2024]